MVDWGILIEWYAHIVFIYIFEYLVNRIFLDVQASLLRSFIFWSKPFANCVLLIISVAVRCLSVIKSKTVLSRMLLLLLLLSLRLAFQCNLLHELSIRCDSSSSIFEGLFSLCHLHHSWVFITSIKRTSSITLIIIAVLQIMSLLLWGGWGNCSRSNLTLVSFIPILLPIKVLLPLWVLSILLLHSWMLLPRAI